MKYITETFTYTVPDDCNDFVTIQDYIDFVDQAICLFYDGNYDYIPEDIKRNMWIDEPFFKKDENN